VLRPLPTYALATAVALIAATAIAGPAAAVAGVSIVGYVTDGSGPVDNASVNALAVKGDPVQLSVPTASTDASGRFEFDGVLPGTYQISADKISFDNSTIQTLITYLGDTPYASIGDTVAVDHSSIDVGTIQLQTGGGVQGTVSFDSSIPVAQRLAKVDVFSWDPYAQRWIGPNGIGANGSGHFSNPAVIPGPVLIRVGAERATDPVGFSYADGASTWWKSSYSTVASGSFLTVNSLAATPVAQQVYRVGGADRFEMAVNVSKLGYPEVPVDGVDTVFIANGLNFPDALSAGPVASGLGPLLLVLPTEVPDEVFAEVQRLNPKHIVIVGGPASVTPSVVARLSSIQVPDRVDGADRYAVSRTLAAKYFPAAETPTVILATGANYPDALAAGPLASYEGAPVVLVPPGPHLDADTRALLIKFGANRVMIAGGPGSVSPGIEADLDAMASLDEVTRMSGADRYVAAYNTSSFVQPQDVVLIANGASFPDALAGSWLGGMWGAPILLAHQDCIPDWTVAGMRQRPDVYLLGGSGSLSPAVESLTPCP